MSFITHFIDTRNAFYFRFHEPLRVTNGRIQAPLVAVMDQVLFSQNLIPDYKKVYFFIVVFARAVLPNPPLVCMDILWDQNNF